METVKIEIHNLCIQKTSPRIGFSILSRGSKYTQGQDQRNQQSNLEIDKKPFKARMTLR